MSHEFALMLTLAGVGTAAVALLMLLLWFVHLRMRNAAIVDVGWAAGLAVFALVYAVFGEGDAWRRAIIGGMVAVWGLRLAFYLLRTRVIGHEEDGRYQTLRRAWGAAAGVRFFVFFEAQALLAVVLSLPILLSVVNRRPALSPFEYAAVILWVIALAGEATADHQLARFKANPAHRGRTCREGLWNYSRHPNYFFEWLVWVAYALFALGSPRGYLGLIAPALMLYFLFRVTGIPATEAQALESRGEDYRRYQETTSAFVPWPRSR